MNEYETQQLLIMEVHLQNENRVRRIANKALDAALGHDWSERRGWAQLFPAAGAVCLRCAAVANGTEHA